MITVQDAKPLSIAAATAAAAGAALGLWLALPAEVADPPRLADPQPVDAIDPNLARYQQVVAAEGASPGPYLIASAYSAPHASLERATEPAETVQSDEAALADELTPEPLPPAWRPEPVEAQPGPAAYGPPMVVEAAAHPQQLAPPPIVYGAVDAGVGWYPNSPLAAR